MMIKGKRTKINIHILFFFKNIENIFPLIYDIEMYFNMIFNSFHVYTFYLSKAVVASYGIVTLSCHIRV